MRDANKTVRLSVDGQPESQLVHAAAEDSTLSDWLDSRGYPLNTRCGGKGVCRGCSIILNGENTRSCQISLSQLSGGETRIEIPRCSLHSETLEGVSAFEINRRETIYRRRSGIGFSLDIGTTTVAGALWDLSSGKCLAVASVANAQRRHGDNVLARIDYAVNRPNGSDPLQAALVQGSIEPLLLRLYQQAAIPPNSITEGIASGNTVMLHTLLGESLKGFTAYPFHPEFLGERCFPSISIGIRENFPLRLTPCLGAFVGGDILAGALAAGITEAADNVLLIDFGTNGEILLRAGDRLLATATAAGPAFEGGRLMHGTAAAPGVIGGLRLDEGRWLVETIGDQAPDRATGISGAAYIDFIAEARSHGFLNPMGRLERNHPLVESREIDGDTERLVAITDKLFITEADVAEIVQAKAAILGGALALMEEAGVSGDDLQTIFVAGGFGYHLDPDHSVGIGLLPETPTGKIKVIGNASLAGASLLLQADLAEECRAFRKKCEVIELNQLETFEDHFIDAMALDRATP